MSLGDIKRAWVRKPAIVVATVVFVVPVALLFGWALLRAAWEGIAMEWHLSKLHLQSTWHDVTDGWRGNSE